MLTDRVHLRSGGAALLALSAAAMVSGCARPSVLRLEQPHLSGPQQRLELRSEQVYWTGQGPVYRLLAEMPLPGAGTGRPAFLLYLRVTEDANAPTAGPVEVRGFLVQTRGAQAGLTPVVEAGVSGDRPGNKTWKLRVDLRFEDSSRLTGFLIGDRADWKMTRFETRSHTADVQGLLKGSLPALRPLPQK